MANAFASAVIPASAERVWGLVRDFSSLSAWHSGIATGVLEGEVTGTQVGAVRSLTLGDGAAVRERLVSHDDADRSYTYDIIESPFPVRSYRSTIRLHPITATGETFAEWFSRFDSDASDEAKLQRKFSEDVYGTGLRDLIAHFRTQNG